MPEKKASSLTGRYSLAFVGGFDLASEWMGWENVFHCEWNEFGQKILKYYWPNAISYGDITKTDFTIHRGEIDILTGGFPCQPYSMAGKRKGKEDERHLWPEMLRAIREIHPGWIVGENVPGIVNWSGGLVFNEVQTDLENEGYKVLPVLLPACGVNAPHKRERVWFVAHTFNSGYSTRRKTEGKEDGIQGKVREAVDTGEFDGTDIRQTTTYNKMSIFGEKMGRGREINRQIWNGIRTRLDANGENGITPDTNGNIRCKGRMYQTRPETARGHISPCDSWINQWQTWDNFPTQPPICSRDDGISSKLDGITFPKFRNESIKAYGNAIVPQVVFQIFKAIKQYEQRLLK